MIADSASEVVYAIAGKNILSAIVQRLGKKALTLSVDDIRQAREEDKIAITHNMHEGDSIDMGLSHYRKGVAPATASGGMFSLTCEPLKCISCWSGKAGW
jgi:hypothetical protein